MSKTSFYSCSWCIDLNSFLSGQSFVVRRSRSNDVLDVGLAWAGNAGISSFYKKIFIFFFQGSSEWLRMVLIPLILPYGSQEYSPLPHGFPHYQTQFGKKAQVGE